MMKVLSAFIAGLTVGLLFAPQSGEKTRKKISGVFGDYKDEAKDFLASAADNVESTAHSAKQAIKNF
jgi:gas vesicle protein